MNHSEVCIFSITDEYFSELYHLSFSESEATLFLPRGKPNGTIAKSQPRLYNFVNLLRMPAFSSLSSIHIIIVEQTFPT